MGQSVVETQDDHPLEGMNGRAHRVVSSNHSSEPVPLGFHYLRRLCRERGILFEDPEFSVSSAKIPTTKHRSQSSITWMRPYELCARPKFISETTSRFDIEQGELEIGPGGFEAPEVNFTGEKMLLPLIRQRSDSGGFGRLGEFYGRKEPHPASFDRDRTQAVSGAWVTLGEKASHIPPYIRQRRTSRRFRAPK
ncbi:hypothetical protein AVEN_145628-1 [Araneus ventricosus]|uniref:Calpain catalytic domain-containing protein n=1 Tax=Araneus ventricosus TaxID=182803 RepID=A0A4Y2JQW0_ARAVE|nr:hypothetical protein AVEN_145628-1 [Araneus ventricosus]